MKISQTIRNSIQEYCRPDIFILHNLFLYLEKNSIVDGNLFKDTIIKIEKKNKFWPISDYSFDSFKIPSNDFIRLFKFFLYVGQNDSHEYKTFYTMYFNGFETKETLLCIAEIVNQMIEYGIPSDIVFSLNPYAFTTKIPLNYKIWFDYLKINIENNLNFPMNPSNITYYYNRALQFIGRKPIIYDANYCKFVFGEKKYLCLMGNFPCDDNNRIIFDWIGIKLDEQSKMKIKITPGDRVFASTTIFVQCNADTIVFAHQVEDLDIPMNSFLYYGYQYIQIDPLKIKFYRKKEKISRELLADKLNVSKATIQRWEQNASSIKGIELLKLMEILKIPEINCISRPNINDTSNFNFDNESLFNSNFEKYYI